MTKLKIPEEVGFLTLMAILFMVGFFLPWTIILGKAGLLHEDIANQLDIYSKIFIFIIGVIILYVSNLIWKQNNKYGDNIGIFNKEETIFRDFTYPQMTLLSFIIFPIFFLIANVTQNLKDGLFGLRVLPQQFSPIDSLLVSTAQIPIAENLMAAFFIGFIVLILMVIAITTNMKKEYFKTYRLVFVTLGLGILGYIWHLTAYPGSDIAKLTVGIFWALGGFISIKTGFIVPFLAMHMSNNFFIDFSRLYSSDVVLGTAILIIASLIGIYVYVYGYKNNWKLFPIRM